MGLAVHEGVRVLAAVRRGSSWPVVVETRAGLFLTKLRGAAQGVAPLIAEIVVAELAAALGLAVPERAVVTFGEEIPSNDHNDELANLLAASVGQNLGFRLLVGALDLRPEQARQVDPDFATSVLWLDGLTLNPDRTSRNPNILFWNRQPWLIDHGAALSFHYDWAKVTEQSPREAAFDVAGHLFSFHAPRLTECDEKLAAVLSREVVDTAVSAVPAEFLTAAFPADDAERLRAAYSAYLWKRLKAPRPFLPTESANSRFFRH